MADKDLHDIKIDELDSPKKTPLKNILTLLALLFIILVISVVITKLILNTDEGSSIENNDSGTALLGDKNDTNITAATSIGNVIAGSKEADKNDETKKDETKKDKVPLINSNITERNLTSAIKAPLTSHEPKKLRTYKDPKKNETKKETTKKEVTTAPKKTNTVTRTRTTTPVKTNVTHRSTTTPKKEYIDKVVIKKNTTSSSKHASSKNASFLGGKRKDVSNSYYIKVGTYRDISTVLNKIKKNNFNYSIIKVENDKTLLRVLVGPFFSRSQANGQLAKVKANILSGAYVTKAK